MVEIQYVSKLEIIGIPCDDEEETIAKLCTDEVECMTDVIKQETLLFEFGFEYTLYKAILFMVLSLVMFLGVIKAQVASTPHGISIRD